MKEQTATTNKSPKQHHINKNKGIFTVIMISNILIDINKGF